MSNNIVVESLVKACRAITLTMKYVKELGYTQSTKVYDCPVCKTKVLELAKKKGNKPVVRAYKKVLIFKHPSEDILIAACPCGYRKIRKPKVEGADNTPTCGCGAPLPDGRKKFCYMCRPAHKGALEAPKEADSQQKAIY